MLRGADAFARTLAGQGIQPGEVVVLILQHSEDLLYSFWGSILHGAIPSIMPFLTEKLAPEKYRQALKSLFEVSSPAAVITFAEFIPEAETARANSSVRVILTPEQVDARSSTGVDWDKLAGMRQSPQDILLLQH